MNPKPQTAVYVAYVIPNPAESQTFYPQAVVKNTQTGAIVATINLTQDPNNSLRYTGSFISPADSTGMGYYLDVITIPYTDTAHTVSSLNYWAATNQYFVSQSINGGANYGGGYMDFDPKKLRKLFQEELRGFKPVVSKTVIPEFPKFPAPQKIDLEPTNKMVQDALSAIADFRSLVESLPKFEKTDQSGVVGSIGVSRGEILRRIDANAFSLEKLLKDLPGQVREDIKTAVSGVLTMFEDRFEALLEKGIPVRSPVFQEEKKTTRKEKNLSDITQVLSARKTTT